MDCGWTLDGLFMDMGSAVDGHLMDCGWSLDGLWMEIGWTVDGH